MTSKPLLFQNGLSDFSGTLHTANARCENSQKGELLSHNITLCINIENN